MGFFSILGNLIRNFFKKWYQLNFYVIKIWHWFRNEIKNQYKKWSIKPNVSGTQILYDHVVFLFTASPTCGQMWFFDQPPLPSRSSTWFKDGPFQKSFKMIFPDCKMIEKWLASRKIRLDWLLKAKIEKVVKNLGRFGFLNL